MSAPEKAWINNNYKTNTLSTLPNKAMQTNTAMKKYNLVGALCKLLLHGAGIAALLLLSRIAFMLAYIPAGVIASHKDAYALTAFNIVRFDCQIASYVLLLPTILVLLCVFIRKQRLWRFTDTFNRWFFTLAGVLVTTIGAIDFGFYRNFHSHINLTFFDFFNEGPLGLLQTMWEEYHVLLYLLLLIVVGTAIYLLNRFISLRTFRFGLWSTSRSVRIGAAVVFLACMAVALRGSVWRFPLQIEDTKVSEDEEFNAIVPNSVYMLKKAWKEKKHAYRMDSMGELLDKYHFKSLQEALDVYTTGKLSLGTDTLATLEQALFSKEPDARRGQRPNVLIIYAESWSNYLMNLDRPNADMLFGMRRHLKEDLLWRNFQSTCNATISSIENITVSTPFPRLFTTKYRLRTLPTSLALPFNNAGYSTEFRSGMDLAWENCKEALAHQQFGSLVGKYALLKAHPAYGFNPVGVYDEHLFSSILEELKKKERKPRMMLVMTTTNHPPFEFPANLKLPALPPAFYKQHCFAESDEKVLGKYITGFRYFNRELARFLDAFKKTAAAQNTIVVVTGDHNVRSILDYNVLNKRWEHSVPLYIYLPPSLRPAGYPHPEDGAHNDKTERWGCHDDILATIAPFCLGGTRYFKMGENLLADSASDVRTGFYSYNEKQILAPKGKHDAARRKTDARNLLRQLYFQMIM